MENENKNRFGIEENLIILSKQTIDEFLKYKNAVDLISVYSFYYYTAKWQQTNQPKAVVSYVVKGLSLPEKRVKKARAVLKELGLITDIRTIDAKTMKITGFYIKLNYIWKKENESFINEEIIEENNNVISDRLAVICENQGNKTIIKEDGKNEEKNHKVKIHSVKNDGGGTSTPNALSANNKCLKCNRNALSVLASSEDDANTTNDMINMFKEINPSYERLFLNKTERKAIERMTKKYGNKTVSNLIAFLPHSNKAKFAPIITKPTELENKLGTLKAFWKRQKNEVRQKGMVI